MFLVAPEGWVRGSVTVREAVTVMTPIFCTPSRCRWRRPWFHPPCWLLAGPTHTGAECSGEKEGPLLSVQITVCGQR